MVVEHDEEIIRAADYIIDIGPNAGRLGGEVVYQGDMKDLKKGSNSTTGHYQIDITNQNGELVATFESSIFRKGDALPFTL